jgi:hypothetical protein
MQRCQCGETVVELLFNLPRCINSKCRFFNRGFLKKFIAESIPIYKEINEYGWLNPFYLGPFGDFYDYEAIVYDLWYVEPGEDYNDESCFVAQYDNGATNCYWHTVKEMRTNVEIRGQFPELEEAMRRFDAIE